MGLWASAILIPMMRAHLFENNKMEDVLYDRPFISFLAFLTVFTLFAPLVPMLVLNSNLSNKFIKSLTNT